MTDQTRNLNPHAAACVAMTLWGAEYSAQRGGSMDFWDGLPPAKKRLAARIARNVRDARPYTGRYARD